MALTGLTNLQPLHSKTFGIGTFDNAVSIGGTLTYEDVTNVDAIGIITARSGVNVSGGQLDVGSNIKIGNAGVITATSFVGDGSGLTGAGPSLTGSTNNTIVTVTGANAIQGESNLTFDGTTLTVSGNASANAVQSSFGGITTRLGFVSGSAEGVVETTTNHSLVLGVNSSEKLRIDSSGRVLIGETSVAGSTQKLVIGNGGAENFEFSPAMTSNNLNGGLIEYLHRGDGNTRPDLNLYTGGSGNIKLYTNGIEKFKLDSGGQIHHKFTSNNSTTAEGYFINNQQNGTGNNASLIFSNDSGNRKKGAIAYIDTGNYGAGDLVIALDGHDSGAVHLTNDEKVRFTHDGKLLLGTNSGTGVLCVNTGSGTGDNNTVQIRRPSSSDYSALMFTTGATVDWSIGQNSAGDFEIFEDGADSTTRLSVHTGGTVQVQNHLTSRNGIVQINQVTSTTRYSGSPSSVDLITGSTFTPKTSAPRFLIMIFCPVNTSDDSDAAGSNQNSYFYGRIEYRKSGGGWIECDNQGITSNQGGYAGHVELSPNRTGDGTTDYWTGNRYRTESKTATILVTNVGDCGSSGNVQFKLRSYSYSGNFIQIGQPHGNGTDDNYGVQPWGFTVFELAPDSNSYTAY